MEKKELVRIYPGIKQKFILVRVIRGEHELVLLWGNPNIKWHKDILEEMREAGLQALDVLGGGWLFVDQVKGVAYVWGKSDRFGLAPIGIVKGLLGGEVWDREPN